MLPVPRSGPPMLPVLSPPDLGCLMLPALRLGPLMLPAPPAGPPMPPLPWMLMRQDDDLEPVTWASASASAFPWARPAGYHHHAPPPAASYHHDSPPPAAGNHHHTPPSTTGHTAVRPYVIGHAPHRSRPRRVQKVRRTHKVWPSDVKLVILQNLYECVDIGFRTQAKFSDAAYRITAKAIARDTKIEITYGEVESLMET
ncbi:hypothetical protein B0T24DRAFT_626213 [Lasiosphaeria ovina]|uniref:Uncharacterized protein n=1 Tax=Lasiosphaeria ovina TaxID=92902 RepID=A0AAE0KDS1_9PEZI|nr:hypothetical protein B0T24DRAFT_626213 [Lasiosphaeria ovina]